MASDPRVFFASERTLLAWLRTGITIVGLGFVVSRFGLFLQLVGMQAGGGGAAHHWFSNVLGVALVLLGSIAIGLASLQHGRFMATLPEGDRPESYSRGLVLWISSLVAFGGLVLAIYLMLSAP